VHPFHLKLYGLLVFDIGLKLIYEVLQVPDLLMVVLLKDCYLPAMGGGKLFLLSNYQSLLILKLEFPCL